MITAHEAALTVVTQPLFIRTKLRRTMTMKAIEALNERWPWTSTGRFAAALIQKSGIRASW